MNMNLGIRKMALGGIAALAIAGGALTSCNKDKQEQELAPEISIEYYRGIGDYDTALAIANKALLEARKKEVEDSTAFVKNPDRNTMEQYSTSFLHANWYKKIIKDIKSDIAYTDSVNAAQAKENARLDSIAVDFANKLKNKAQ